MHMIRLLLTILLLGAPIAQGAGRYVTDRAGAPVRWREWGPVAVQAAVQQERPIFLSIGFAASWECEQMHREAFANARNAAALNDAFVPVLLDRIEHPEVAAAFEAVASSMTGLQGSPANLILTPELEVFAVGGPMSSDDLGTMLVSQATRWADERAAVLAEARAHVQKTRASLAPFGPTPVTAETIDDVLNDIASTYDPANGGFGGVPRQPHPTTLSFLLRHAVQAKDEGLRERVVDTLRKVVMSPVRDQLGGGFHRATRDAAWQQPYYEKMLADQALMSEVLLDAWRVTKDPDLLYAVRTTLDYAVRDLQVLRELFDASQDAHNLIPLNGPEFANGAVYYWKAAEVRRLIGDEVAGKVLRLFDIVEEPSLPRLREPQLFPEIYGALAAPLAKLLDVRLKRPAPFRERGTAAGNGLMISALARASILLEEPRYREAAVRAGQAIEKKLWKPAQSTLLRTADGTAALHEDYAFAIGGMLDLFEATNDIRWFELAVKLQKRADVLFWNADQGRYTTGGSLPMRLGGLHLEADADLPSSNAAAARNLLRLAALTGTAAWSARPPTIFRSFGGQLQQSGAEIPSMAEAFELSRLEPSTLVITGDVRSRAAYDLLLEWHKRSPLMRAHIMLPHKGVARERVTKAFPWTAALAPDPEGPIAYLCAAGECRRQ
jgi:uncharacterized protein